jgi:hypothetical protein
LLYHILPWSVFTRDFYIYYIPWNTLLYNAVLQWISSQLCNQQYVSSLKSAVVVVFMPWKCICWKPGFFPSSQVLNCYQDITVCYVSFGLQGILFSRPYCLFLDDLEHEFLICSLLALGEKGWTCVEALSGERAQLLSDSQKCLFLKKDDRHLYRNIFSKHSFFHKIEIK